MKSALRTVNEALRIVGGVCAVALVLTCMVLGAVTAGILVGLRVWE